MRWLRLASLSVLASLFALVPGSGEAQRTGTPADLIFFNGRVLTMERARPRALAIRGDTIVGVGSNERIRSFRGPDTIVVNLRGRTLLPGFVDAHTHSLGLAPPFDDLDARQQHVLEGGVTSIGDPAVWPAKLESLLAATATTDLRLRVGLYLMYNTKCSFVFPQDWYFDYPPDHDPRRMLRVLGVKLFADPASPIPPFCGWAKMTVPLPDDLIKQTDATPPFGDLILSAEEMAQVISDVQARRYQVVIHVRGDAVLDAALDGIKAALNGGRNIYRHRIDHNDYVRPDQVARFGEVGVLPLVRGRPNACLLNSQGNVDQLGEAVHGWVRVARSFIDANRRLPLTWHSDTGEFKRRPMHDLYELVTKRQVDPDDGSICEPPEWLAAERVSVAAALRMMTINGAHALFAEDAVGSLRPGKLADVIVLSDNPLRVDPDTLPFLDVLMTMVGGNVEHCLPGYEALCPVTSAP